MKTITKEFQWDCAHKLNDNSLTEEENKRIFGKCNNLHGHTYKLFVTISSSKEVNGMIMNFTILKEIVQKLIIDRFDHKYLNEDKFYMNRLSTCENQIVDIWNLLAEGLDYSNCELQEIKLYETPTSFCTLTNEDV